MRKILFLDVDGVLNNLQSNEELCDINLNNLKTVVKFSNCEIVLSSTWRLFDEFKFNLKLAFEQNDIPLWKDQTPRIISDNFQVTPRRDEIISWLKSNIFEDCIIVIVDDESDANIKNHQLHNIKDKFIHTDINSGLNSNDVIEIINFFK